MFFHFAACKNAKELVLLGNCFMFSYKEKSFCSNLRYINLNCIEGKLLLDRKPVFRLITRICCCLSVHHALGLNVRLQPSWVG